MLFSPETLGTLAARLRRARVAVVPCSVDPLEFVRAGRESFADATYFRSPQGPELGGLGRSWSATGHGPDRLEDLAVAVAGADIGPGSVFSGFAHSVDGARRPEWDGFASAEAVLPVATVRRAVGRTELVVSLPPGAEAGPILAFLAGLAAPRPPELVDAADHMIEARPGPAEWRAMAADAVDSIRAGAFTKVVLARSVMVRSGRRVEPFDLAHRMRTAYPQCFVFGWQRGPACFVGASPELLVSRTGRSVRSHLLAGSAPRGEGDEEDRAAGEALLASAKDRHEHEVVVEDLTARLAPLVSGMQVAPTGLLKMATVQHLSTHVGGELLGKTPVLAVAAALHPTPAVGGMPRSEALAYIDKVEDIDRGWYSGGVGWSDGEGDGEIALGLRCALLRDDRAIVYAGAGIVADSDPDAELAETRLKLRPLLGMLAPA